MSSPIGSTNLTGRFLALAKTTKFAWFIGHFIVVLSSTFYWLSLRQTSMTEIWYRLVFFGAMESFGVLVYQTYGKSFSKKTESNSDASSAAVTFQQVSRDENVLYFILSTTWLILSPRIAVATVPFFIISLFHVLTYIVNDIAANVLQVEDVKKHPYLKFIDSLVSENHETSLNAICNSELISLFYNFVRLLTLRPRSIVGFVAMSIFIKLKCFNSAHMKRSISKLEVRLDGLIAHPSVPHSLKTQYTNVKLLLRRTLASPSEKKTS
ncbi:unnamed protein product [Kluyveromyces dobzhanskii CBS 2104]|uniref:WGS project CCBQ000000000 data, contig 00099 n=1 Tax=Kluyveromyces dobzhanskii CBS 2104 TaxID=1427455 RepID=A0A0A8L438_9SACH|nr:unnamed protein product [Kluyveromyces dobzhanskii CBS 2104]